ncbi:MAG: flagellar capping protein FliD [Phycisphaerales bacterium]|jgi:flagellar capping protein FliD
MSGITSTGLFSGIDANQLIEQLLQLEARPKVMAQNRLAQLQSQQAAYLDLNNRLSTLKSASAAFRVQRSFDSKRAASTNADVITATAGIRAQPGSYKFVVDRLVSTQQVLTRGFSDRDNSAVGLDQLTIESAAARLDRNTPLADLNDGQGVDRGKILVNGIEVDLSRAATVNDVLNAINNADGLTGVSATVTDGSFMLEGITSIANVTGDQTADSLGLTTAGGGSLVSTTLTGGTVYGLNGFSALSSLNDGRGVSINTVTGVGVYDFAITVAGVEAQIRLGEIVEFQQDPEFPDDPTKEILATIAGSASNMSTVLDRINTTLQGAGLTDVTASLDTANGRLVITDGLGRDIDIASNNSTTAEELGIAGSFTGGTATGERVLAGMNSTLVSSLNGASGLTGDGLVQFDTADASSFSIDVSVATTLDSLITLINSDSGNAGAVTASLNSTGNGLQITDNTTGANDLVISGTGGADTATSLGLAGTFADSVASGENLQLGWVSRATRLDTLANGLGTGTGSFRISDSYGNVSTIKITENDLTLNQVIDKINKSNTLEVTARINDTGDGLIIEEDTSNSPGNVTGASAIKIEDLDGVVADRLKIEGEASGVDGANFLNGSYEQTITFDPDDTLNQIVTKINNANPTAEVAIINDGSSSAPFRLSFAAENAGSEGRFLIDSHGFDLDFNPLDEGNDALIFYGSEDPADGILLTSSTNLLENVIQGVSLDISTTSDEVIEINITQTLEDAETQISEFVTAFNDLMTRIDELSRYSKETGQRAPLLGDGTTLNLRSSLVATFLGENIGFNSTIDQLASAGVTLGGGGQIEFNSDRFRAAYERDPQAVEDLFTKRDVDPNSGIETVSEGITARDPLARTEFTALGVINQIEQFADDYITSIGGTLTERSNALNSQIQLQQQRIANFDVRLESRRQVLSAQFLAMEQSIAQFQSQGSTLAMLG